MAGNHQPEMKIPVRPAPAPPGMNGHSVNRKQMQSNFDNSILDNKTFFVSRSVYTSKAGEKKKPPPRPPPPKKDNQKTSLYIKTTDLFPKLFHRKANVEKSSSGNSFPITLDTPSTAVGALIDFHSPPSSPTLTTRSSSDGISINSFGSDSINHGINSNGSQVESGFEDDFDFFMASTVTTPTADSWSGTKSVDPFSPIKINSAGPVFDLSNEDPRARIVPTVQTNSVIKPTIIRAKNGKPLRPPPPNFTKSIGAVSGIGNVDMPSDWSPPMPCFPPPPPPPEALDLLANGPKLPPRPNTLLSDKTEKKRPYCIAQYDYEAGHSDDLSFKVNDVISLTDRVNEEWLRGRLMGKEGMFPASFVKIVVPLEENAHEGLDHYASVIALFTFKPETWDDLPFQEGDNVRILRRVNDNWLYGECNGRRGQFPASYVSDVSAFFPISKAAT
uniref:SH3 domain-containing protein n=1 Tax=Clastoptera arizonana TaxID=38151 RepID=A0A1B6C146_9HEMI